MMNYPRLQRLLKRAKEVGCEADAKPQLVGVYKRILEEPLTVFLAAYDALEDAESSWRKESGEAHRELQMFDAVYKTNRSVLAAHKPDEKLPDTLKACTTDTDKVSAIERMLHVVEGYKNETWAAEILAGEFGTQAPTVIQEISEAIDASKQVTKAKADRARAYGLAYEKLLAFKRVVRDACGPTSKQYSRIHIRRGSTDGDLDPDAGGTTPGTGAGTSPTA
jgi:hypothetical protein